MTKEEFLKKLNQNLCYLKKKDRNIELMNYQNLDNYNLDPVEEANKIYAKRKLNARITTNVKFINAFKIIIDRFNNHDYISTTILFFVKLFFIIILIKIPFIYLRDMVVTLLYNTFTNDTNYMIWNLIIELSYAITSIFICINQIKKESLKNME